MNRDGLQQAAQVVRTHLASFGSPDRHEQVSVIASLVYGDRLNEPPIYPHDPDALDEVVARYSGILGDHLDLAAVILSAAAGLLNTTPDRLLDDIVQARLGGYD